MTGPPPPSGTVTFLFTDAEGSTSLLQKIGAEAYANILAKHREILRAAFGDQGGIEVGSEGDSLFYVFRHARPAVDAARRAQLELYGISLSIRMGLHTGEALVIAGEYVGIDLHKAARIAAAARGGQILLSATTAASLDLREVKDLGEHRLKDLTRSERIFQLAGGGLRENFPPVRSLGAYSHNLPIQPTPLVGRQKEIAELQKMLAQADIRLLSMTGPGGTGKTRLALQVAAEAIQDFPGGVYFVDLAPLTDPALVPGAILQAVGIHEAAARPLSELLNEAFEGKKVLLLLDNCEQLVHAAPSLAEALTKVPGLTFLATSRVPFRIRGELEYPLGPLPLPARGDWRSVEALMRNESIRLFVERAQAVRPSFVLTEAGGAATAEICHRLDGLPLAIELAAARCRIFSPQALLPRLANRLAVLVSGARDLPDRHQTLRGAIAWSYELLSDDEATLFRRVSVFSGHFGLDPIEACCAPGEMELSPVDGVASLVEKNLLRVEAYEHEPRFRMLETILEFAFEKLEESGETDAIAGRHAAFYLGIAEEAGRHLSGAEQPHWLSRIESEYANLRAAMRWALNAGSIDIAARIAVSLRVFWMTRGLIAEGRLWAEEIISQKDACDPALCARILGAAGNLARQQGQFSDAKKFFEQALDLYTTINDVRGRGVSLTNLGAVAVEQGDHDRAEPYFIESLALLSAVGEERLLAMAQLNLGVLAEVRGDLAGAESHYQKSLGLARKVEDFTGIGLALNNLSHLSFEKGDRERAEAFTRESLRLAGETGNAYSAAYDLTALALCSIEGDPRRATRLLAAAKALFDGAGAEAAPVAKERFQKAVDDTRRLLPPNVWEQEWNAGSEMSLETAISFGLRSEITAARTDRADPLTSY